MSNKKTKSIKDQEFKETKSQISEVDVVKAMLARALADYDNLSKRIDREKEDLGKIASVGVITKFLPVLDNLERAQTHLQDSGLAMAIGEFINVLRDEGLHVINPCVGDQFDEKEMEAIEVLPGERDNTILEVVLPGWKFIDGTVVRHAKVKVSKKD